jgi:branched-chain amino acid transport system permease protein
MGRAFAAVRDNEAGAEIVGVNIFSTKMGAFILSSFLAGIAGALYASYFAYAEPNSWGLALSIQFVAALLIGGVASVWGSILGAAFVFALPQALTTFSLLPQTASSTGLVSSGNLSALTYGLLIIVFLLFEPAGLIGLIRRLQVLIRRWEDRRKGGETPPQSLTSLEPETLFDVDRTALSRHADAYQASE